MQDQLAQVRDRGFAGRVGFGVAPALLVVDFTRNFTAPATRLGADMAAEIGEANRLIAAARHAGAPIYFSTIAYDDPVRDAGVWADKIAGLRDLVLGTAEVEQDPRLDVAPSDRIVVKRFASCFFGTTLADDLRRDGVDTLVIAGCTTSGCVRASAVDACQHGFRAIVAREATADRLRDAHTQSLIDIDLKYGDVLSVDAIVAYFAKVTAAAPREMKTAGAKSG
jgi:maleamate amidohydrolase